MQATRHSGMSVLTETAKASITDMVPCWSCVRMDLWSLCCFFSDPVFAV